MRLILHGEPLAKQRHRHNRKGNISYDPQKQEMEALKTRIILALTFHRNSEDKSIQEELNDICNASHFRMYLEFHCTPPLSDKWGIKPCSCSRDCDNMLKLYQDACNSILYSDDHLIVDIHAIKCYSVIPKTIIDIYPMEIREMTPAIMKTLNQFSPDDMKTFLDDVGVMANYCTADLEILTKSEIDDWTHEVACLQYNFACKWAAKLNKIAKK